MQNKFDEIQVSDKLDSVVYMNMNKVKKAHKKAVIKKVLIGFGTTAVVFMCGLIFCVSNPVFAGKLPFIGGIFVDLQDDIGFSGDYSEVVTPLETSTAPSLNAETTAQVGENTESIVEESQYLQTVGDVSMTLVESYCNNQALYFSLIVTSEDGFGETCVNNNGLPYIILKTEETYSFSSIIHYDLLYVEGEFIDEKTFAGIVRFDLTEKTKEPTEYYTVLEQAEMAGEEIEINLENAGDLYDEVDLPSEFSLNLEITQIVLDKENPDQMDLGMSGEELEALSDEEWNEYMNSLDFSDWGFPNAHENIWFDGPFEYDLAITIDETRTITKEVDTTNDAGIGIESVIKSPFEITINQIYPSLTIMADYYPVILDANGERLDYSSGTATTVAIQNRDVSTIDIYICHWDQYVQIKGTNLTKELLEENAAYHVIVEFE